MAKTKSQGILAILIFFGSLSLADVDCSQEDEVDLFLANTQTVSFEGVTRNFFIEKTMNGKFFVLIVDVLKSPYRGGGLPQKMVLRQVFDSKSDVHSAIQKYKSEQPQFKTNLVLTDPVPKIDSPLWPIKRDSWTEEDEQEYAQWIDTQVDTDFIKDSGLVVDCADTAIALRWIFAHDHQLPMGTTLPGSNHLFGSWRTPNIWKDLPTSAEWRKDERFKAALAYVTDNAYTHSLFEDLYPIEVNKKYLTPGAIHLSLRSETGHTQIFKVVGPAPECGGEPCLVTIWGNVPAADKIYRTRAFFSAVNADGGGFLRFRWVEKVDGTWKLKPKKQMPGYSMAQYEWSGIYGSAFEQLIYSLVGLETSPKQSAIAYSSLISTFLNLRLAATLKGHFTCSLSPCAPGGADYEASSTFSRDRRIKELQSLFVELLAQVPPDDPDIHDLKDTYARPIISGGPLSFSDLIWNSENAIERLNPDPKMDFSTRWGFSMQTGYSAAAMNFQIFKEVWNLRNEAIRSAYYLCFPRGGPTPTCSFGDPAVLALNTDSLDAAFKIYRDQFWTNFANLSAAEQQTMTNDLLSQKVGITGCNDESDRRCSYLSYLKPENGLIDRIKSKAHDPFCARYGF